MMDKLKIIFLGTGSAIPTKKRNHSAVLLQYRGENILMDCGEGTQRQFRIAGLNPCKLTRILISHWHADHVLGLPGLLQTLMLNGYNKTLKIYGPKGTKRMMELYMGLFVHKGNKVKVEVNEINSGRFVDEEDFFIESEEMEHDAPCLAYRFNVKERKRIDKKKLERLNLKGKVVGELVKGKVVKIDGKRIDGRKLIYTEKGRKVVFVMDTRVNSRVEKFAKNADLMICEATYSSDREDLAEEYMHLTTGQACRIAKKAGVKKLYLTHFSQRHGNNSKEILKEARRIFRSSFVAEDFDEVEV